MFRYLSISIFLFFCCCTNTSLSEVDSSLSKLELDDNFFGELDIKSNTLLESRSDSVNNFIEKQNVVNVIRGKVISIIDGDTFDLLTKENETIRIRVYGIDAPEKGMPYYNVSKKYLSNLIFSKTIEVQISKIDRHDRFVAKSFLENGTDISLAMIQNGMAWHYAEYSSEKDYADAQIEARGFELGIWKDKNVIEPWEVRSLHRRGISTKKQFQNKIAD